MLSEAGVRCLPWGGRPAGQPGSSPGPDGAGRSAWPPPGPGESPPTAASHWLPLPPGTPPWLGSAINKIINIYEYVYPPLKQCGTQQSSFNFYFTKTK